MAEDTKLDEAQLRREAAERALQANQKRNADRLARMEEIADSAEKSGEHVNDEELPDEAWEDHDLTEAQKTARAIVKAQENDEAQNDQGEEKKDDEARDAGADDVREEGGVKQYRLTINGKEVWKTLEEIRTAAQKVEAADEYLQTAADTVRRVTRDAPTAEEAAEADRKKQERRSRVTDILRRQAMGDEKAIDELAELIDSAPSVVTPDVLRTLDERFDSRVTFRDAVSWFEDEYAAELKHQAMKSYAGDLDARLAAQDPKMPPKERLRRVGNQIRQELKETYGLTGKTGPSEKAIRKAEVRRPEPAGERRKGEVDEEETEDTQSIIQGMAKARHQPRAVVHGPVRK
jgi:hypothetical protein